jgi:hypothetical protein
MRAAVQVHILPAQAEDPAAAHADSSRKTNAANSRIKLPVMEFQCRFGNRRQGPAAPRPVPRRSPKGAKAMFLIILIIIVIIAAAVMLRRRYR